MDFVCSFIMLGGGETAGIMLSALSVFAVVAGMCGVCWCTLTVESGDGEVGDCFCAVCTMGKWAPWAAK